MEPAAATLTLGSWNVAGWATTLSKLSSETREYRAGGAVRPVDAFIRAHGLDVLCLQEVKTSDAKLVAEPAALGADAEHYESFWAPCRKVGKGKGFNGVATYVRKGLCVAADRNALRDELLDAEGRCLAVELADLVIFNVYVPNDGSGSLQLPLKCAFLEALRAAMQRARGRGKAVVLAGDLNLVYRPVDSHWESRRVDLARFMAEPEPEGAALRAMRSQLLRSWVEIEQLLAPDSVIIEKTYTTNPSSGARLDRWQKYTTHCTPRRKLGRAAPYADDASFRLDSRAVGDGGKFLAWPSMALRVPELVEVMALAGTAWSRETVRALAASDYSICSGAPDSSAWLKALLAEDGMVDSFPAIHGEPAERFTCWNQHENRRFRNAGARIDYILVDSGVALETGGGGLDRGSDSRGAAAAAAGSWQPAPFDGSLGIQVGRPSVPCGAGSTGICYTSPALSDHVMVQAALGARRADAQTVGSDRATKATQPQKAQKSLLSFFSAKVAQPDAAVGSAKAAQAARPRAAPPKKKKRVLTDFFAKPPPKR